MINTSRLALRKRPSSRLLIVDENSRVLLFHFTFNEGALAGREFWSTPGGGLKNGETFEQAGVRELKEETGIDAKVGRQIAQRAVIFQMPDGEFVDADERYFLIKVENTNVSSGGYTTLEKQHMKDHKWWSLTELKATSEVVFPENLTSLLESIIRD